MPRKKSNSKCARIYKKKNYKTLSNNMKERLSEKVMFVGGTIQCGKDVSFLQITQ